MFMHMYLCKYIYMYILSYIYIHIYIYIYIYTYVQVDIIIFMYVYMYQFLHGRIPHICACILHYMDAHLPAGHPFGRPAGRIYRIGMHPYRGSMLQTRSVPTYLFVTEQVQNRGLIMIFEQVNSNCDACLFLLPYECREAGILVREV